MFVVGVALIFGYWPPFHFLFSRKLSSNFDVWVFQWLNLILNSFYELNTSTLSECTNWLDIFDRLHVFLHLVTGPAVFLTSCQQTELCPIDIWSRRSQCKCTLCQSGVGRCRLSQSHRYLFMSRISWFINYFGTNVHLLPVWYKCYTHSLLIASGHSCFCSTKVQLAHSQSYHSVIAPR